MSDTYATSFLRDSILPTIRDMTDSSSPFMDKINKTNIGVIYSRRGNYIVQKNEDQSEQGVGARAIGEQLQAPVEGSVIDAKWLCKYNYAQFSIYGQHDVFSKAGPDEAVASILSRKTDSLTLTFKRDRERQLMGIGTGELCKVAADSSGDLVFGVDNAQHLEKGMMIDIHEGTVLEDYQITAIDKDKSPVEITIAKSGESAVTVTADTVITRAGAKDNEMEGIRKAIFPDSWGPGGVTWGTYANINRANEDRWRPQFNHNGGEPRDLDKTTISLIDELVANCQDAAQDDLPADAWLIMQRDLYMAIVYAMRENKTLGEYVKINLGYTAPTYISPKGPIPIVIVKRTPNNAVVYHDFSTSSIRRPFPPKWEVGDGDQILQRIQNYDQYQATLKVYEEYVNIWPAQSGAVVDLRKPAT